MLKKGFTLIELLIVISIIATLATVGLVIYSSVNKNARDAKRQTDLRTIQSALEQYFSDQFVYPAAITFGSALTGGGKTYLNVIPTDPTNSSPYIYCYKALKSGSACDAVTSTDCDSVNKCTNYCLYAKLENPPVGTSNHTCGAGTTYTFKATQP